MQKVNILLDTVDKVKQFVGIITKFPCDFDIVSGRYVVDGKSIMGILALDVSRPHELRIISDDTDLSLEILSQISDFIV